MKKKLLLFITLFCCLGMFQNAKAQTLAAGDIAFIGFNIGGPDGFSFIALKNIPAGEIIYFTEEGLYSGGWVNSFEPHIKWTVPPGVTCGKIISVIESATPNVFTVTGGSASDFVINPEGTAYNFNLSAGDQMLAYQSANNSMRPAISPSTITFIAGIHGDYNSLNYDSTTHWNSAAVTSTGGGAESIIPPGLTDGVNCISLFPGTTETGQFFAKYKGNLTGTSSAIRTSINTVNTTNWDIGTVDSGILPSNYTPNITCASLPTVASTAASNIKSVSATLGGNVTADGGDSVVRGIVWATTANPVVTTNTTVPNGTGTGTYSATITGLPAATTIHFRAYATNSAGTSYGNDLTFTTGAALTVPATLSKTDVSCFGGNNGTATVSGISGGATPYTYSWSPSGGSNATASSLTAGAYSVTVTDNEGTQITRNVTINQPAAALNGTASTTQVSCFGLSNGNATANPTGGTPGYTYLWSNAQTTQTATNLAVGTYSVTITDANGCQKIINNINVGGPAAALSATPSSTPVTCFGGSNGTAKVTPSGGTPAYTYLWSNGQSTQTATGLAVGTYSVTITDANNCQLTVNNIAVSGSASAISGTTSTTPVSCFGGNNGTATVTASGGTGPYTYSWAPSGGTASTATGLVAGTYSVTITDNLGCPQTISNIVVGSPATAISATNSTTSVSCNGGANGTATVTPSGGTSPYTYLWSNNQTTQTANGLVAGLYSVVITDNNSCTFTVNNIAITQPPVLNAIASTTSVSCNNGANGTATIAPSGGTSPYTYLWSNGAATQTITGLTAGTYSVTVTDANSCTKTVNNIVITQPAALTGTASATAVSCFGGANGTATVTASGGTPAYTYSWAPSGGTSATASGLVAGTYSVTITDANSCSTTINNIVVGSPASALTATAGAQTDVLCNGGATGSATVSVSGGTPAYTYSWAPSGGTAATASGLTAGTYTVTVTDANGCQATQSFTISQPAVLNALPVAQTNIACYGGSTGSATVTASGGTPAYTYSWAPTGGTAATATGLVAGTYTVTVTDANGCQDTQSFTITQPGAALSATTSTTNVSCFGGANGAASVTVSGGTPGYTYSWAPSGGSNATAFGLAAGNYSCTITDANGCTLVKNFTVNTPAIISSIITKTDVSCNGGTNGSATVNVTGGTGAYTYSWAPTGGTSATASGLAAGTYTVTITDANTCTQTQSVTINQPSILTATQSQTNVLCNGGATGTATVTASGGTGSYSYLWAPSGGTAATATGLVVGSYSCTITDANGCSITKNFTIIQPSALTATTSQIDATCSAGGEASVNVSGGTSPYNYLWTPSGATTATATGLSAGSNSVVITDANGCTLTKNFVIGTTNTLVATTSQTDILCNGSATGSASVVPSGAPGPFTYVWSPSGGSADTATNLTAGTYSVTITSSNGCSIVKNFTITQPSALVVTANPQTNVSCNGGANGSASVTATGGTGAYTYQWAPTGGTAATASGLTAGTYTVTVKDANLCQQTKSFTIIEPTALVATTTQMNVSCNGGTNGSATVNVTGGTGAYTYSWAPSGGTAATASGLAPGTYIVTVKDANLCQTTASVTITQPATLVTTTSKTDVTCNAANNGTATVNATGGTGAYTYSWAPSGGTAATATGLAPGTYTVTVKDANLCQTTANVTITEPTLLASTVTATNVTCNGVNNGTATVSTTGGTGAYTYLWAPSGGTAATATGLAPGTYSITVTDANSCQTLNSITITQPDVLVATTTKTDVSCNGGSNGTATVNVTGGTGAYSYAWSPSGGTTATASGLLAGTYTVTVTDANSCQTTATVLIAQPTLLTATTSKTDVTCNGANDGTATVNVTGGTGAYSYAWSPSGGTAATATGLSPNTYTVTITDANGCFITKTVNVITTPDVTAPVPTVATLPVISNYCSVLAAQITIPTATDNCSGVLNGTTTDPLTYTATGTYTIIWKYTDASGNITSQPQTVNVLASPISATTLSTAEFTYDGNPHSLQVANLPAGATVAYSANNISTNAGTYAVTATITPSASTPNCSPIVLTANLVIKKAPQQITFSPIAVKILGANNTFNLTATSSASLPITYTSSFSSPLPPATVSATGTVTMLRSGQILITAQQAGDSNYLPATNVSQLLIILNNNIDVKRITVGSKVFETPGKTINYLLPCGENNPAVTIVNESNAAITPSASFTIQTPKPGIYTQNATITSEDGSVSATYSITVEKPFGFYDIVHQKFNNVLLVNNNPQTNGGYEFVAYQWFKNGQLVGTGQYYSASDNIGSTLDPTADYSVKMTTKDGKVLQTCSTKIKLTNSLQAKLYPNPAETGKAITVEADFPQEELEKMQISLYSVSGKLIKTVSSSTVITEIQLPDTTDSGMYLVVLETPNTKKSFKVIVK